MNLEKKVSFMLRADRRAQSIVEMLIATSVIVVSVLGIIVLVNRGLSLNRVSSEEYTATYLASEGIELVVNLFDHSYLQTADPKGLYVGTNAFYGWVGDYPVLPSSGGLYEMDYDDTALDPNFISPCSLLGEPTQAKVRILFASCDSLRPLRLHTTTGFYSYDSGEPTKFKRVIIIQPSDIAGEAGKELDYRVTSAVGWESKGGEFVVQLEHHLLPWRTL